MCSARTNQDYKKKVQEEETINFILVHHTGLRPVFSAPLAEKVPLT